jgi:hypothetical protein
MMFVQYSSIFFASANIADIPITATGFFFKDEFIFIGVIFLFYVGEMSHAARSLLESLYLDHEKLFLNVD